MRVLFQSRKTLFTVPGGDTIQILKTAEALRSKGCAADISTELEPDLTDYDIVHLFNLTRPQEVFLQALNAKKHGKKIALSTIYVDFNEYEKKARGGIGKIISSFLSAGSIEYLKVVARAAKNREINKGTAVLLRSGYRPLQDKLIEMIDVFLPNSASEMKRVIADFPRSATKDYIVVPNAVDEKVFNFETIIVPEELRKYEGCVLSVARIEGLKCQLELVRAMKGLPWPLVLIGKPAPNHLKYFESIKREAGGNVYILGQIKHEMLPQFYKLAKVHALVSWMETTGLSSLEAGIMGCNLVITKRGDTYDYFGDYANYCEPDSIESIRNAIKKAYEAPKDLSLHNHILRNYTWTKAADMTMEGYRVAFKD